MDERAMTGLYLVSLAPSLLAGLTGGLVVGFVYFSALRATADLIVCGGPLLQALALTMGRIGVLGAGLLVAALSSGPVLLAALVGVLCAKTVMLRRARRSSQ